MNEEKNIQKEAIEDVPEELYAPLGDVSFNKPKKEVTPEYVSYKNVDLAYSKKPFNTKRFFRILLFLVLLMFFVGAGFLYVKNKKNVYRHWLNEESKKSVNQFNTFLENKLLHLSTNTPFLTSILVNFEADYDTTLVGKEEKNMLDTLNQIHMSYALGMDIKNKELSHTLKSTYNNENLLTIYGNGNQDSITLLVRNVTGKYLEIPNHAPFLLYGNDKARKKDMETFRKYLVRFLLGEIQEEDLIEEEKTLLIDGKEEKVRDISLSIPQVRIEEILKKAVDTFGENKIFKEKMAYYFHIEEQELETYLQKIKKSSLKDIEIHVYAKPFVNKIVGYEIKLQKEATYVFQKMGDTKCKLMKEEEVLFDLEKKENQLKGEIFSYSVEINKKNNQYEYSIQKKEELYKGTIQIKDTELKLSKQGNIVLTLQHLDKGQQEISNVKCSFIYNTKTVNQLSKYDDTQKMSYQDLSTEELAEIKRRIKETNTVKQVLNRFKEYIKKKRM